MDNPLPASILCIIATEFCERFSFCGLRTILSLYLRNELHLSENSSTMVYHIFIMICYILPIVGAICADSFLGRYRTIFYFSIVYLIGNIIMVITAIPIFDLNPITMTVLGLALISIGTGGAKPCLAAFGGDQFYLPMQKIQLQQFFSIFYFSINLGGFVGMIITPIMRKAITCFGDDTCYALGFGFPAVLIFLSLLIFVMGKQWYRLKTPKGNVVLEFAHCTSYAIVKNIKKPKITTGNHWLDSAKDRFGGKLIYDMKIVFAVLFLYTPLPLFWSLFDQQGSRWTFQASKMRDTFLGLQILPDQMQVVNPAFVLIFIPLFDRILYPYLEKMRFLENPLHRMAVGGLIAGVAFLSAGLLELFLQQDSPYQPGRHTSAINFINTLPCDITMDNPFGPPVQLNASDRYVFVNIPAEDKTEYNVTIETDNSQCGDIHFMKPKYVVKVVAVEYQTDTILIGTNGRDEIADYITDPIDFMMSMSERPKIRIAFIRTSPFLYNITVILRGTNGLVDTYYLGEEPKDLSVSQYIELVHGGYDCMVLSNQQTLFSQTFHLALGGVYSLVFRERHGVIEFGKLYTISPPNNVSIMWLIPQYFLISIAEIMFGIAGLEFSFTQAPKSMKTVTIAAWYLSVAIGNLIVIVVTQLDMFKNQAFEFFFFAILIVADMMIFTIMASQYTFVQLEADSSVALFDDNASEKEALT
ncbi:peptide transporter family 1-like isoform X2 [Onthophagus taurus]|uniref:peptide transporter family 1-like isoform X2 n=1 Tax=Onthophagus taurus TaxID=166361 RepID=UPI0039BDECC9